MLALSGIGNHHPPLRLLYPTLQKERGDGPQMPFKEQSPSLNQHFALVTGDHSDLRLESSRLVNPGV